MGSACIFDWGLDKRKKYAQRRTEEQLMSLRHLLDKLVDAFDAGNQKQLDELFSSVRRSQWSQMGEQERSYPNEEQNGQGETEESVRRAITV